MNNEQKYPKKFSNEWRTKIAQKTSLINEQKYPKESKAMDGQKKHRKSEAMTEQQKQPRKSKAMATPTHLQEVTKIVCSPGGPRL